MRRRNKKTVFTREKHENIKKVQERKQTYARLTGHWGQPGIGSSSQQSCPSSMVVLGPDEDRIVAFSRGFGESLRDFQDLMSHRDQVELRLSGWQSWI